MGPGPALVRDPGLAIEPQPDGRLLLRHRRGRTLLGGVAREHLDRLLSLVDGRRTLADLQALLAAEFEPEGVAAVVGTLLGCGALSAVAPPVEVGDGPPARSVGILGGGTAGWLAALALRRHHPGVAVTLIESPRHPAIGVGEATTPLLPQFLHADLGLDARDLFAAVRPTLKLGIRFDWGRPVPHRFDYPFGPLRVADALAHDGGVATASPRALLMEAGKVPAWLDGDERPALDLGTAVAYHLDNRRFVAWLVEHGEAAGVERVEATVADAALSADGCSVRELVADDGRRFAHDLWIDASGFASRLLGEALGSPWISYAPSLATDRAAVATLPAAASPPYTRATTWDAGWCWSIPQRDEVHCGYVYASAFLADDAAADELARRLPEAAEPRLVRFRCGRRAHFVRGNVAALGNAYGFVEPLESTALHLLVRQIGALLLAFPWHAEDGRAAALDRRVASWWDYLAWFLSLHYRFNRRLDTPFWRATRDAADVSAWGELIERYRARGPLSADPDFAFDAPDPLWGAEGIDLLLAGQGVEPGPFRPPVDAAEHRARLAETRRAVATALTQDGLLAAVDRDPAVADAFAEPFRAHGPAFAPARAAAG